MKQHSKIKKMMIALSILLICGASAVIGFYSVQPQLVTGRKSELQCIVLNGYPAEGHKNHGRTNHETVIIDKDEMYAIYNEFKHARPIIEMGTAEERPYTMVDPFYTVKFCYSNWEETVSVYGGETVRFLGNRIGVTRSTKDLYSLIEPKIISD